MTVDIEGGTCSVCGWATRYGSRHYRCGAAVDEAIRAAVLAEREACAKIADREHAACWHASAMGDARVAARIGDAIRTRGAA